MAALVRYLTHPQVRIDPEVDVPDWGLSPEGRARVMGLAHSPGLAGTTRVISSRETKAVETARPLAEALGAALEIRDGLHENDRSATGYLPGPEFEALADRFFARPDQSAAGWETARDASTRICRAVDQALAGHGPGDVLFVGHGGVGTLLWCALSGVPIDRKHDQGPGGGGNWFGFDLTGRRPLTGWQPLETLIPPGARGGS